VVTVVAMLFALRDVELGAVVAEFRRANLALLFGLSVPAYLLVVWLRALRWRHLTDPIQPMPRAALFRAVAVGFMANNVFPLRMGEFVRAWYLGRECEVSPTAIFGSVILERVIDTVMVIVLALSMLSFFGAEDSEAWRQGLVWLLPVAVVPFAALAWLHAAPEKVVALTRTLARPLPASLQVSLVDQLERFAEGLGALRGGVHLFWIGFHTLSIWLVASTIPMVAGFMALDIDFGSPLANLMAGWMTLAAVGIAVALPSAPGFFGLYHSACRLVLERFGMAPEIAVAVGTLLHAVFWLTLTVLGLVVLRLRKTPLEELDRAVEGGSPR
jgi:uncharacterized protein (TIRG00374 family)